MKDEVRKILDDLYEIDPGWRGQEEELIPFLENILTMAPSTRIDEDFVSQLRCRLLPARGVGRAAETKEKRGLLANFFRQKKLAFGSLVAVLVLAAAAVSQLDPGAGPNPIGGGIIFSGKKVDDWQYSQNQEGLFSRVSNFAGGLGGAMQKFSSMAESIGLATGGAKDVNNFRENIKNNYLPLSSDITYEGLFYDYFFATGQERDCEKLFCPSYSYAVAPDPFSQKDDYYLSVGLNSGISQSDFSRKKLNLVVVLDISGSMGSAFDRYYYDQSGGRTQSGEESKEDAGKTKIELAAESIAALLDHLRAEDRFGMVVFDDQAAVAKPIAYVGETDMDKIKEHILGLREQGGTNMSAGMKAAWELLAEYKDSDQAEYENRIIFLTDAMPNTGDIADTGLLGQTSNSAADNIYATFIGIGVDFNTDLIERITKIRGANYYSVHSAADFKKRMDDEFEYMVTPLVFDLNLALAADGWEIEKVYGSPEADEAAGQIMKVNTLFPSARQEGQTKGGIVLLKLKKISSSASLKLKLSYRDRQGKTDADEMEVEISSSDGAYFANSGIRKGIVLARYADLIKNWINDERMSLAQDKPVEPAVGYEQGLVVPYPWPPRLSQWERQSTPLRVSGEYKKLFQEFNAYFESEMEALGDSGLRQESEILKKLGSYN